MCIPINIIITFNQSAFGNRVQIYELIHYHHREKHTKNEKKRFFMKKNHEYEFYFKKNTDICTWKLYVLFNRLKYEEF